MNSPQPFGPRSSSRQTPSSPPFPSSGDYDGHDYPQSMYAENAYQQQYQQQQYQQYQQQYQQQQYSQSPQRSPSVFAGNPLGSPNFQHPSEGRRPTSPPRSNTSFSFRSSSDPVPNQDSPAVPPPVMAIYPLEGPPPPLEDEDMIEIMYAGDLEHTFGGNIMRKSRKEYCVLTNRHLLRFKTIQKAMGVFENLLVFGGGSRRPVSSVRLPSDSNMIAVDTILAVHESFSTPPTIRVDYVNPTTKNGSSLMLMTDSANSQAKWLEAIRGVVKRHIPYMSVVSKSDRGAAMERLRRHMDIPDQHEQMVVHKVVLTERRARSADGASPSVFKEIFLVVLLVIGKINLYILPTSNDEDYKRVIGEKDRLGLMAISNITFEGRDDTVQVTVRVKGGDNKTFLFASSWCENMVQDLRRAINSLTQFYPEPPYDLDIPYSLRSVRILPLVELAKFEDRGFDKLLEAHCAALNLDKRRFSFTITEVADVVGARKITVNPPNEIREGVVNTPYNKHELLAIFRSLRHNLIFREISFANTNLSEMEKWIPSAEDGWATMEGNEAQNQNALSNELYVMITSNKKLRKLDLTNCTIGTTGSTDSALSTIGRAMQTGQIGLNSIFIGQNMLTQTDVDMLIAGIKVNRKAVKELGIADCQLKQQQIDLLFDTFISRSPEHLNTLDISDNQPHVNPDKLDLLLRRANHLKTLRIRKIDIPIEPATMFVTRLRHLDVGGTRLTDHYIANLCSYIMTPAFNGLESLSVDDCGLNGSHFQEIFQSISQTRNRNVHLKAGSNPICKEIGSLPKFCYSILQSEGPSSLSLARTEWDDPSLREFLECLRTNSVIRHLDLAYIQLPTNASEDTVRMLAALFERNSTLEELILTGEETLLCNAGFGKMIVQSFPSLVGNTTLKKLNLTGNLIGDIGAFQLAEVLKKNKTLKSLEIDGNKITMEGFKYMVDSMSKNDTLTHISRPTQDLKYQMQFLTEEIKTTFQAEGELKFVLAHSAGTEARKVKEDLDTQIKGRRAAEKTRQLIGGVIDELCKLVERNRQVEEEIETRANAAMANLTIVTNPDPPVSRYPGSLRQDRRTSWERTLDIPASPALTSVSGGGGRASPYFEYNGSQYGGSQSASSGSYNNPSYQPSPSPYTQYVSNGSQSKIGRQNSVVSTATDDMEPLSLGRSYYHTQAPNMI